jgi:hypothetical protein
MNVGCQAERKCNTGEREKIKDDGKKRTTFAAKGQSSSRIVSDGEKLKSCVCSLSGKEIVF